MIPQKREMHILKLPLSDWCLDVFYGEWCTMSDLLSYYYGASREYYEEEMLDQHPSVFTVTSKADSHFKGQTRIVFTLPKVDYNSDIIYHEAVHVMWHYANNAGLEINYHSQEWQALLVEHIIRELEKIYKETGKTRHKPVYVDAQKPHYWVAVPSTVPVESVEREVKKLMENGQLILNRGELSEAPSRDPTDRSFQVNLE